MPTACLEGRSPRGGTSARTPVFERDGTHSECPRETNPQNYFHHAFHEDAKPGDERVNYPSGGEAPRTSSRRQHSLWFRSLPFRHNHDTIERWAPHRLGSTAGSRRPPTSRPTNARQRV